MKHTNKITPVTSLYRGADDSDDPPHDSVGFGRWYTLIGRRLVVSNFTEIG